MDGHDSGGSWLFLLFNLLMLFAIIALHAWLRAKRQTARRRESLRQDNLLQGFQGIVLCIQAATERVADREARALLEEALQRADQVLAEAREAPGFNPAPDDHAA